MKFPVVHLPNIQDFLHIGVSRLILSFNPVGGSNGCASNNLSDPSTSHLAALREAFTAKCGLKHLSSSTQQLTAEVRVKGQAIKKSLLVPSEFQLTLHVLVGSWPWPWPEAKANSRSTHPFCPIHKAKEGIFNGKTLEPPATKLGWPLPGV